MTKILLNEVMCLTHGFFPFNLITKLDRIVKVVPTLKLNDQSGSFYNLMTKVALNQKNGSYLNRLLLNKIVFSN